MRLRIAVGVLTRPSMNEVNKRNLVGLVMPAVVRECFGILQI